MQEYQQLVLWFVVLVCSLLICISGDKLQFPARALNLFCFPLQFVPLFLIVNKQVPATFPHNEAVVYSIIFAVVSLSLILICCTSCCFNAKFSAFVFQVYLTALVWTSEQLSDHLYGHTPVVFLFFFCTYAFTCLLRCVINMDPIFINGLLHLIGIYFLIVSMQIVVVGSIIGVFPDYSYWTLQTHHPWLLFVFALLFVLKLIIPWNQPVNYIPLSEDDIQQYSSVSRGVV